MLPGWSTWAQVQAAISVIGEQGMMEGLAALSSLGLQTIVVIETGGAIIGLPAAAASYVPARAFFRAMQERRLRNKLLKSKQEQ